MLTSKQSHPIRKHGRDGNLMWAEISLPGCCSDLLGQQRYELFTLLEPYPAQRKYQSLLLEM